MATSILVVYATKTGCTQEIADRIGDVILKNNPTAEVAVAQAKTAPTSENFDAIIVGSGIRVGQFHGAMQSWLKANAGDLADKPIAAFAVCLMPAIGNKKQMEEATKYCETALAKNELTAVETAVFAGCFEPKKFSFPERMMMRAMKAPEGDHRNWTAIETWAASLPSPFTA